MNSYKLLIAYVGTQYSGWQIQPNATTIQELIQNALKLLIKEQVTVIGSGRTDAGVHAIGQVAHFRISKTIDCKAIQKSLNGILPPDIRILNLEKTTPNFHARYSATGKIYHYHLYLDSVLDPFRRNFVTHIQNPFDRKLLKQSIPYFHGKKDFTSFANEPSAGAVKKNPIRTLKRLECIEEEGGIRLEFEADGFLYKMVRNIVGTLIEVCTQKRNIEEIPKIFAAKDRRQAGKSAPPQGLFLIKVLYSDKKLPESVHATHPDSHIPESQDSQPQQ